MRRQRIVPGWLTPAYETELARFREQSLVSRIWDRDPTVWKIAPGQKNLVANRLGWLSVVDIMRNEAADLTAFATGVEAAGLRDIVLLGMGGSTLAPEVFSRLFPAPPPELPAQPGRRFFVLDTSDPESLLAVERSLDLSSTLFIVASKSGTTIETISQFKYFLDRCRNAGILSPGAHFVAITDPGSPLEALAKEHNFRRTFLNPADIGGRYSALSFFGLLPATLWGVDVNAVLNSASEMCASCGPQGDADANPALHLGALLGCAASHGYDKLFLLAPRNIEPLCSWIEQLVAESTGKEGRGIVPIVAGPDMPLAILQQGSVTVALSMDGIDDPAFTATMSELEKTGAPFAEIEMAVPTDLGAEFFRWELATVMAAVSLEIDPFDEPHVQESKDATARILGEFESSGEMPKGLLVLAESGIELFTEFTSPGSIQALQISDALRNFLSARRDGDYLALLAFVARDFENTPELESLRLQIAEHLNIPVLLGFGPRYLHSIGQTYKGGPPTGLFIVITSEKSEELPIPDAKYTFAQLEMAQALGDLQRLALRQRPSLRLHLAQGARAGLAALRSIFNQALSESRPAVR